MPITSNLKFCSSIHDTRYLLESPQFAKKNSISDSLLLFENERYVSNWSSSILEEYWCRQLITIRRETFDGSVIAKRILGLEWPRFSRDLEEILRESDRASIFSTVLDNDVPPIDRIADFALSLSPPSTLFRARKPPPAGTVTCYDVFTKATLDTRSSMRLWKWVIRSLTEIFSQDFALVP